MPWEFPFHGAPPSLGEDWAHGGRGVVGPHRISLCRARNPQVGIVDRLA